MLILYYRPSCPFCQNVLGEAETLGVQFRLKNISADVHLVEELIEKGGKKQVPFLVDTEREVSLYESVDIMAYLDEHYGSTLNAKTFGGLKVHKSDGVCDTCQ